MKLKIGAVLLLIMSAVVFNACKKESNDVNPTTQPGNDPTGTTPAEKNDGAFKFKVKVEKDEEIKIFTYASTYTYDYQVDWGDGSEIETNITGDVTHKFAKAGELIVSFKGKYPSIYFSINAISNTSLIAVMQWGSNKWENMYDMFSDCKNFTDILAKDQPDLSQVKSMNGMFYKAKKFNGNIGAWDVSKVEDMHQMFYEASAFNQDISGWNVGIVTNMTEMFYKASTFNQDISGWNVEKVNAYYNNFATGSNLECKNAPSFSDDEIDIGCRGSN